MGCWCSGAGISDFNGDGHPDYVLFLQNAKTPQTAIWYLNNNVLVGGVYGPTLPSWWFLGGVADFNRDGHPDYVLLDSGDGRRYSDLVFIGANACWTRSWAERSPRVPSGWGLVGAADFNGDGHPDYLLYNSNTRQTAIWYLNNNVYRRRRVRPNASGRLDLGGHSGF